MAVHSAGILLYRLDGEGGVSAFVVHMGGPYWATKDEGAWSIPKGALEDGEDVLDAAKREFRQELGVDPPEVDYAELGTFAYSSGKRVTVYVGDGAGFDEDGFVFGEFEMEWPPRSGKTASFPEVDRAEWMPLARASELVVKGQRPALERLAELLAEAR